MGELTEAQRAVLGVLAPLPEWAHAHTSKIELDTGMTTAATMLALHGLQIAGYVDREAPAGPWWRVLPAGLAALSDDAEAE